jgi:hypothetical protein
MAWQVSAIPEETAHVMRMKVGVSRQEATDRDGSVGATCEIEVEIPGGTPDAEVLRIRDHWLGLCEATVDEELDRLQNGTARPAAASPPASSTAPSFRPKATPPAPASAPARPEYRGPSQAGVRRASDDDDDRGRDRDRDDEGRPPIDGRQLLGWAAKQVPDAKGLVISFGKRKGYPTKIVDWDDEQVRTAYRYARAQSSR